jgi:hypothetical protein
LPRSHQQALTDARQLADKRKQARQEDEQALRAAASKGCKPPQPKTPDLERRATEAAEQAHRIGHIVIRSGIELVSELDDAAVMDAIADCRTQAAGIVDGLPELVGRVLEDIARMGALRSKAMWMARLVERRRQAPFRGGSSAPPGPRMAMAAEAARRMQAAVEDEIAHRGQTEPEHRASGWGPEGGFTNRPGVGAVTRGQRPRLAEVQAEAERQALEQARQDAYVARLERENEILDRRLAEAGPPAADQYGHLLPGAEDEAADLLDACLARQFGRRRRPDCAAPAANPPVERVRPHVLHLKAGPSESR